MSGKQKYKVEPTDLAARNVPEKNAKVQNKRVYKNKFPVHNLLSGFMAGVRVQCFDAKRMHPTRRWMHPIYGILLNLFIIPTKKSLLST